MIRSPRLWRRRRRVACAAMAAALLRMGRLKGVARPAIAVPIPVPGRMPQILVDGGAASVGVCAFLLYLMLPRGPQKPAAPAT